MPRSPWLLRERGIAAGEILRYCGSWMGLGDTRSREMAYNQGSSFMSASGSVRQAPRHPGGSRRHGAAACGVAPFRGCCEACHRFGRKGKPHARVHSLRRSKVTEAVKRVYAFGKDANGNNVTEGNTDMKWVLGGKGANQ